MPKRSLPKDGEELLKDIKEQKPYHSHPSDFADKENLSPMSEKNLSQAIVADEPLPMRKKRKARGCNLRESLAWNAAFSTEEGVLDPDELSNLSASVNTSGDSFLSRIDGGTRILVTDSSSISAGGSYLKERKGIFSKEFPTRPSNKDQKLGCAFDALECTPEPRHLRSMASLTDQSAKRPNKLVPKHGGCPRPLALYSQKRFTKTETPNATSKLSKLKPSMVNLLPVSSKNVNAKSSQSTPTVTVEKSVSTKGTPENTLSYLRCVISSTKSSAHGSRETMNPQFGTSNVGLKTTPEPKFTPDVHAKPSRLRMPSPSLKLFAQKKASSSCSISAQKNAETQYLLDSGAHVLRKPELKPSGIPIFRPPPTIIGTSKVGNSSTQLVSISKDFVPSVKALDSHQSLQSNLETKRFPEGGELKGLSDLGSSCNQINDQVPSSTNIDSSFETSCQPCGNTYQAEDLESTSDPFMIETLKSDCEPKRFEKVEVKDPSDTRKSCYETNTLVLSSTENIDSPLKAGLLPSESVSQGEDSEPTSNSLLVESQIAVSENSDLQDCGGQCESENDSFPLRETVSVNKQDTLHLKLNAVPFSEDWLAAVEAAGEDILKMKTGPVQNSPPNRSLPEPSPWSPVKRNIIVGPFDCTKCTTNLPPPYSG